MKLYHMSGAGNDFMVMDARGMALDFAPLAVELCQKHGTDGFMAVDHSNVADFRLHFYNSDGSRGEMCGNGARCICKFAYDLGIAGETMTVQADAGIVYGWRVSENRYRVKLNNPGIVDLRRKENAAYIELGDPGIPHSVTHIPGAMGLVPKSELKTVTISVTHPEIVPEMTWDQKVVRFWNELWA